MRPGGYALKGAKDMGKGGDKFDVSTNLIINPPAKDKIAADKDKVFATLSFPKPRKITSLRVAPNTSKVGRAERPVRRPVKKVKTAAAAA